MTARVNHPDTAPRAGGGPCVHHRPLIPIVAALAAGIFVGGTWPGHGLWAVVTAVPMFGGLVLAWHRRRRVRWLPLFFIGVLGYVSLSPWLPADFPDHHIARFTDSRPWEISGELVERLPPSHGRSRFVLEVAQIRDGRRVFRVTGRIRVTVTGERADLLPGARLTFTSRIRSFHNFGNPGAFDYRRHMAFQRISGSAFVGADRLRVVAASRHRQTAPLLNPYRHRARAMIGRLGDADTRAVMQALLVGDRSALSPDLRQVFNRCGVGHLLAISGLHVGIVGGLVFGGFLWLLHRCPPVLDRGWGRRAATLLAVGPVLFYAMLSGMSPATQRALIMVLAFMATYFVFKDGDTLNFLALAALLMLIWKPPALFSISFQMSFAAVFWIVVGLANTSRSSPSEAKGRWAEARCRVALFLRVTCWATAGTLPLTMTYFQEVSLIGLAANCFMVPLTGFFVLPIGLCALFLMPIHEQLAGLGIEAAGWGLSRGLGALKSISAWDGVALQTFIPTPFEIVCYFLLLGLIAARTGIPHQRFLWLVLLAALLADGLYWGYQRYWHGDLRVTVLDVGQGSAALVAFPGGRTMLIDGGGTTSNRYFDMGARVLAPFLRRHKIMQVDTLVLSHPSTDHMNGLVFILKHFQPQRLLWTGDRAPTESFREFLRAVAQSGAAVPPWKRVERHWCIGDVAVRILNPPATIDRPERLSGAACNDRSIVLKLTFGRCSILFPGDIEDGAEAGLLTCCGPDLSSGVLIAPHHGSRTSSTEAFLSIVAPETVIISAGWMNRFGFPHPSVLQRYRRVADHIYRTDRHGAITLRANGKDWKVTPHLD